MSWLKDERTDVAQMLAAAGLTAYAAVPDRVVPPLAMVVPGSPYLEDGQTIGAKRLHLDIWLIPGNGENEAITDALDEQIMQAVTVLEAHDITVENVSQPIQWSPNSGGQFLTSVVSCSYEAIPPTAN